MSIEAERPALALSATVLVAGVLMLLAQAGVLELGWAACAALACLAAGGGLIVAAPVTRAAYTGTLTRLDGRPATAFVVASRAHAGRRSCGRRRTHGLCRALPRPGPLEDSLQRAATRLAPHPGHRLGRPGLHVRRGRARP